MSDEILLRRSLADIVILQRSKNASQFYSCSVSPKIALNLNTDFEKGIVTLDSDKSVKWCGKKEKNVWIGIGRYKKYELG